MGTKHRTSKEVKADVLKRIKEGPVTVEQAAEEYGLTVSAIYRWPQKGVEGAPLTLQALGAALLHHPRPLNFHSDNGKEYEAKAFIEALTSVGSLISRSHPGCPWENGYQESSYDKFKVDLGDPNRFHSLGELVATVYRTVWTYNHTRIHSALEMPPAVFAEKHALGIVKSVS